MREHYPKEVASNGSVEWYKIYHIIEPMVKGKFGLDLGCGAKALPGSIGVDFRKTPHATVICDVTYEEITDSKGVKLYERCDYVFSSHLLEDYEKIEQVEICLRWTKYLKKGGLLILYVPQKGAYTGCNVAHKGEFILGDMERLFVNLKLQRILIYYENLFKPELYGILGIGKKGE